MPLKTPYLERTSFPALQVYATLSDPERREAYDAAAGLLRGDRFPPNPMLNASHPRDRVFVDEVSCIGCRNCNNGARGSPHPTGSS